MQHVIERCTTYNETYSFSQKVANSRWLGLRMLSDGLLKQIEDCDIITSLYFSNSLSVERSGWFKD